MALAITRCDVFLHDISDQFSYASALQHEALNIPKALQINLLQAVSRLSHFMVFTRMLHSS